MTYHERRKHFRYSMAYGASRRAAYRRFFIEGWRPV